MKDDRLMEYLILPGYGNSGPEHWQTRWEGADPAFRRVQLGDWERPDRNTWVTRLEEAVSAPGVPGSGKGGSGRSIVLVAHSLACLLVAHWAAKAPERSLDRVKAVFLVAPVDPAGPAFPKDAASFGPAPLAILPFPTLVVASSDDPYSTPEFSRACADAWGSRLSEIGAKGHINAASGLGDWPEGMALLRTLVRG
jgi:predicted alpha/beta hydrolase family esterase